MVVNSDNNSNAGTVSKAASPGFRLNLSALKTNNHVDKRTTSGLSQPATDEATHSSDTHEPITRSRADATPASPRTPETTTSSDESDTYPPSPTRTTASDLCTGHCDEPGTGSPVSRILDKKTPGSGGRRHVDGLRNALDYATSDVDGTDTATADHRASLAATRAAGDSAGFVFPVRGIRSAHATDKVDGIAGESPRQRDGSHETDVQQLDTGGSHDTHTRSMSVEPRRISAVHVAVDAGNGHNHDDDSEDKRRDTCKSHVPPDGKPSPSLPSPSPSPSPSLRHDSIHRGEPGYVSLGSTPTKSVPVIMI
jgi:hypothetical protein